METGLPIRVLVCDGPSKHLNALRLLGATPKHPYFYIGEQKIYTVIDPPYRMKAI